MSRSTLAVVAVLLVVMAAACAPSEDATPATPPARSISHAGLTVRVPDGWWSATDDPARLVVATSQADLSATRLHGPRIVARGSTVVHRWGDLPDLGPDDAGQTWTWRSRAADTTVVRGAPAAVLDFDLVNGDVTVHHRTVLVTGDAGASALFDLEAPGVGQGIDTLAAMLDSLEIDPPAGASASATEPPPTTGAGAVGPGRAMAADMVGAYGLQLGDLPADEATCLADGFDAMTDAQRGELDAGVALSSPTAHALERMVDGCLSAPTQQRLLAAAFAESTDGPDAAACVAKQLAPTWTFGRALAVAMADQDTGALLDDLVAALDACGS